MIPTPPEQVKIKVLIVLILSFTAVGFGEDFKTINGKEYNDATVSRAEPDGIVLKTKSGIIKVYFTELPKDVQERFHYDSEKATSYSSQQTANYVAYQKQQEEAGRQQADADARNRAILVERQAATNRMQVLQARYTELQKQEDDLLLQIGRAQQPGPAYYGARNNKTLLHHPNPQKSQLPFLQSHLSDVRREKKEVRKQLEKVQR